MADNTLALQVQPTQFGNNFAAGYNNGLNQQAAKQQTEQSALEAKQKSMQGLYALSYGVLRDGEVNPEEWNQAMDWAAETGAPPALIERLRGKPEMAKVIANSSAEALRLGNDERALDLQFQKLAQEIQAADTEQGNKAQIDEILRKHDPELADSFKSGMIDGPKAYELLQQKLTGAPGAKAPDTKEVYDPGTGRKQTVQWKDGKGPLDGWYPLGGLETPKDPKPEGGGNFDDVSGLRKEIQQLPSYKNLAQAGPIYSSMLDTAGRNSKASDLNLVYGLGKIMDPTSVVREGEMVMVKNTASLPDWLVGSINALNGGQQLTPDTRKAILAEAYSRMQGYQNAFGADAEQYRGIAERNQINVADVIPTFKPAAPWSPRVTKTVEGKSYFQDENGDWFEEE